MWTAAATFWCLPAATSLDGVTCQSMLVQRGTLSNRRALRLLVTMSR
jgi:hypothetical protein